MKKVSVFFVLIMIATASGFSQTKKSVNSSRAVIPMDAVNPKELRPDQIFSSKTKTSAPVTTPLPPTASATLGVSGYQPLEQDNPLPVIMVLLGLALFFGYRYAKITKEEIANRGQPQKPSVPILLGIITDNDARGRYVGQLDREETSFRNGESMSTIARSSIQSDVAQIPKHQ